MRNYTRRVVVGLWMFSAAAFGNAASVMLGKNGEPPIIVDTTRSPLAATVAERLSDYIQRCIKSKPEIRSSIPKSSRRAVIVLGTSGLARKTGALQPPSDDPEAFSLTASAPSGHAMIYALGATDKGIKRAVQKLILLTRQESQALSLPETRVADKPWKSSREYMMANWRPDDVRTKFSNRLVDKRMDPFRYSEDQLVRYARMFDDLGFSGVQLAESSVSWSMIGSKEAYQEILRRIARAAHDVGEHVSYMVWAAEFNVGWIDPEVVYAPAKGMTAYTDPRVRRGFEKYYDHYSQIAPYVDLVIGHWFDAGRLTDFGDVINYQKLLRQKMLAKNPRLEFGVNTWGHPKFIDALLQAGMNDFLILEMSMPNFVPMEKRVEFRKMAKESGFKVGMWGWYMTEYESDQAPNMHVNGHVMKEYINNIRQGAEPTLATSYWSEMEAHHINNIYTMGQTAQLLWNPDRDPDEILHEIVDAVWGPRDGPAIYEALKLIEDTRSGPSWDTFSYLSPGRRDGTPDPEADARRARQCLAMLGQLMPDPNYAPKISLPVSRETLLELMLPHLEQIRLFAEFRRSLTALEQLKATGVDKGTLQEKVTQIWQPIPEFNTWIGTYGQAESWRQEILIRKFCKDAGIEPPVPKWKMARDCQRALEKVQGEQRVSPQPLTSTAAAISGEFSLDKTYSRLVLEDLVNQGWLEKVGEDAYRLVHWKEIAFPVRIRLDLAEPE